MGVIQKPRSRSRLRWTASEIISTSIWNWSSAAALPCPFRRLTATNEPSVRQPLYTLPNPPWPSKFLLSKLPVAIWRSRKWNFLSWPSGTSGSCCSGKSHGKQCVLIIIWRSFSTLKFSCLQRDIKMWSLPISDDYLPYSSRWGTVTADWRVTGKSCTIDNIKEGLLIAVVLSPQYS